MNYFIRFVNELISIGENFKMDITSLLIDCALFTAELYASCFLYKLYKTNAECFKSLKEAPCFEINSQLQKEVEKNDGVIKFAAISGSIKALSAPLKSQYIPDAQGVIRENVIKEHKVKWIRFLGNWISVSDRQRTINYVPFGLCNKTNGLFKKRMCVEVIEPLTAEGFDIPKAYDKIKFHRDIGVAATGAFHGERTKAVQEVERILGEDVTLTAVGKLIIENNKLKITQPDNGLNYILTPLTKDSLICKVHFYMRVSKIGYILMGTLSFISFIYFSWLAVSIIKKIIIRNREKKLLKEHRKLRRMADKSHELQDINIPKCVICLDYPVEVLLLECGHGCMCYDCSQHIKRCPVCRNPNVRTILAFWP